MEKSICKFTIFIVVFGLSISHLFGQTTKTVGATGADYSTLKLAFDAINAGTLKTGVITLQIIDNTTETATAVLYASGTGNSSYTSVVIYPTVSSKTISGNINAPLIDLNGADNVTIDGRLNATGSSRNLTITNNSTSATSGTSTLRLINDATLNTIKYCTLKGSSTDGSAGIIFLSGTSGTTGNDGNTIDNNDITCSTDANRPVNAIFSSGTSSKDNNGNTYSNNNIYDFLNRGIASNGINIYSYSTSETITGNSFYERNSFVPTASVAYSILKINNGSGIGYSVTGNYIGGSTTGCGSTAWTKTAAYDNIFYAINININNNSSSSIQNNTIKNIAWSNAANAVWTGIQISGGTLNIGTTSGNTIGASTGTGSVTVTNGTTGGNVYGINIAGNGTIVCQNNIIGSITAGNNDSACATNLFGINRTNTGTTTLSGNTIGSTSQSNSFQASSTATANAQSVVGIYNTTGGTYSVSNNTIANLTNGTTNSDLATSGLINGISSSTGGLNLTNNTIRNLTIANANNATNHTASVVGIVLTSTNALNTVSGNTISYLSNSNATFSGSVIGIYFGVTGMYTSNSHTVTTNFIHSLSAYGASSTDASIYGIKIYTGQTTYANNIISLGGNSASTIYGIYETGTTSNNNSIYFNTIYIGGEPTTGSNPSYALYSAVSTNTRIFRNNILQNARSNTGSSGKHYAAYFNYSVATSLTLDNNNYYVSGTGGVLGYYNGSDVISLPIVTGQDANSLAINPLLASAGGTTPLNFKPTTDKLGGYTISNISTDYALTNRAATPTIGAYETTLNLNVDVYKSGVFQASYFRIKDAFDRINSGAHTGILQLRIKANTTETASAVLYQSGYSLSGATSSYSSVEIYPTASGITISGNFNAALIDLNGADYVTIDGRVNKSGDRDLAFSNTCINTYSVAIRYANSAENNVLRYCKMYASCNNSGTGEIYFANSASGNGNSNNLVEYCNISNTGGNRPVNAIFSSGGTGCENKLNIIRNNNIYDVFNPGATSFGLNISYNSVDWTISGNSFYETTTFVPTGAYNYYAIRISTSSSHLITDNYIGGSAVQCGGSPWTIKASVPLYFCMVYLTGGASSTCVFQNNTLKNVDCTSTEDNPWDGIYINAGNVNITGNTIGATTGTGSIKITSPLPVATTTITGGVVTAINLLYGGSGYTTAPLISFAVSTVTATATATINGSGQVTGFTITNGGSGYATAPSVVFDAQSNNYSTSHGILNASAGTVNITGNNLGSITTVGSDYYSHGLETMYVRSVAATINISNNFLGSLSTANSLQASSAAASSLQKQDIYGIYSSGTNTATITGNTIINLYNAYSGSNSGSRVRGISTTTGSNLIQNNTIKNISSASAQNSGGSATAVCGITQSSTIAGTTQTVKGNSISNLSCTNSTIANVIGGIYFSGPSTGTNIVTGNFIHSLTLATSSLSGEIDGIFLANGLTTTSNNIINLGTGITTGYKIYGIWDESGATNNNNVYYNSVYIGGTVSGTTSITAALYNKNNTSTRNYRNNLFVNVRSGGTTNSNYAIWLAGTAGLTIDYNDYYYTGSLSKAGRIGNYDKADLAAMKAGTSQDVSSLSTNPNFAVPGGTTAFDYYTTSTIPGTSSTGVTIDYDGLTRGITPKMGALEYNNYTWTGVTNSNFATPTNWAGGEVPPNGANISFTANPTNHCLLDQNRSLKNITNAQGTKYLTLNGKQLTLTGSLIFSNGAKVDGTTALSSIVYAGSTTQSIASGTFVNNTVDSLTVNNVGGLTLNSDFTINKGIALIDGNFAIGANTLTFNGIVTAMTGTVTGGTSTNMIIGGNDGAINMPAFTLNNVTINRTSGVNLYGNLNLVGTLTLTNGTLTLGSNSLTLYSSPIKTNGNIDASNNASTLIFNNSSPITLPSSIFSNAVNNLSITGVGGVTSTSDFTVNGELNLAVANPSSTKGLLDLWDGAALKTLTMGANASTIGTGDVTGIITRNSFEVNTPYSFGNQFTTINMSAGGELPSTLSVKVTLSSSHAWASSAIHRYYDISRSGGNASTLVTLNLHYLSAELNGATEGNLDLFDYHISGNLDFDDHGRSNFSTSDKWVGLYNRTLTYIAPNTTFPSKYWTLKTSTNPSFTWLGAKSTDWNDADNWVGAVPGSTDAVIIPDASTTVYDPTLPKNATIGLLNINSGGILNGDSCTLTITGGIGAWNNLGTYNAGVSTVVFTNNKATMADPTNFYNVTVADGAKLTLGTDNIMRIAGELSLSATGILNAANNHNTIEYNGGNQTIINPNGSTPGYHNLILSGSGTKTMPATALSILGELTTSGTTTTTAESDMTVAGDINIDEGSSYTTGNFSHSIAGSLHNRGTFTVSEGNTLTFNGTSSQLVNGTNPINFYNLTLNNSHGLTLLIDENVNNILSLTNGILNIGSTTFGINGTISKTSGSIQVEPTSSLSVGGTDAITFPSNLFTDNPLITNLTINCSGGVTLGNQNMTLTGLLTLSSGILSVGGNTLTMSGASPIRTSGSLDASNTGASLVFSNSEAVTLPASLFSTSINNLTISGTGGVTSESDFTVNGILNLPAVNPSTTKGILDMWDGAVQKTLTMGSNATTIGLGDVTGIIRRTSFVANTPYTFGNQYSFITFDTGGSFPTEVQFKVNIGSAPSWKSNAILRYYELIRTGGVGCTASLSAHYLDSELNGISEDELVLWNYTAPSTNVEYGSSTHSTIDNWAAINYVNFLFFPTSFGVKGQSLGKSELSASRWNGSVSNSWTDFHNWDSNSVPNSTTNVIIPDASTTLNSPILPTSTEIKTLTIESAGVINSVGSPQLTVNGANGAWSNVGGTFNPGTGNVTFTNTAATYSGNTTFNNLTISNGSTLWMSDGSTVKLNGTVTNSGTWRTVINGETSVEYAGGAQNIVIPDPGNNKYYNLTLSGTGTKTLPETNLQIIGDFTISGSANITTSADLSISGNMIINDAGELSISTSTKVDVAGSIFNNVGVGSLYVKTSPSSSNGSLIFHNAPSSPVSATVAMYSKAAASVVNGSSYSQYKWQFFGIPVQSIVPNPTFAGYVNGVNNGSYINKHVESGTLALGNYWVSQGGYTVLEPFAGYEMTQKIAKTVYFEGQLVNSDFSQTLSYTTGAAYPGQHILANPYTAAIDISKLQFGTETDSCVYIYNSGSYYDWSNVNGSGENPGQYIAVPQLTAGIGGIPGQIPSMQGFLVAAKKSSPNATIGIPYSSVVTKNVDKQRVRSMNNITTDKVYTRIDVAGTRYTDKMWIFSDPTCSRAYDNGWDGSKFLGASLAPQLWAMETSGDYQVDAVNDINNTELGFITGEDTSYKLTFTHENLSNQYNALYLIDLVQGSTTDITLSGSTYSFTAVKSPTAVKRFKIVTQPGIVSGTDATNVNQITVFSSGNTIFIQNPTQEAGDFTVFDISGRNLYCAKFSSNGLTSIPMRLIPGSYIVKISTGLQTISKQIILN